MSRADLPLSWIAEQRLHSVLEGYYGAPARVIMARRASYVGPIESCVEWLQRWINAGARHISLRVAGGDPLAQVDEAASRLLPKLKRGCRRAQTPPDRLTRSSAA